MYLEMTTWARVGLIKAKESVQSAVKKFFLDEQGDTNMISIIIILVIVVALAVVFRKNIATLVNNMWQQVFKDAKDSTKTNININAPADTNGTTFE